MFGQLASKAVGDYATTKLKEAATLREQASKETDGVRAQQLKAQAAEIESQWGATGTLRLAAHTLIGGLTGGTSGALGAATGTLTAPAVAEALQKAGIDGPLASALTAAASTAVGAVVGGGAGGSAALNEVGNNYLKHSEIIEKETRKKQECATGDSACRQRIEKEYSQLSQERDRLHESCATVEACRAARAEIEHDMAELESRAKELGAASYRRKLTPAENREALELSENIGDALKSYNETWRKSRAVIPFSEWTADERNKTFADAMMALGGLGASGAVGKVPSGRGGGAEKRGGANTGGVAGTAGDSLAVVAKPTYVFRGDGRPPTQIFDEGFKASGTSTDVLNHATTNSNSGLISTSSTPNVAREFADMQVGGYVYTVRKPPQALDVNATLGAKSPYPQEFEIAVLGAIRPQDILGARHVGTNGKFVGPFVKNPRFQQ